MSSTVLQPGALEHLRRTETHERIAFFTFHGLCMHLAGRARVELVEREFGRLKHEWALLPLRVRGIEQVRLHADLTILAKLACALSRARAVPLVA